MASTEKRILDARMLAEKQRVTIAECRAILDDIRADLEEK